jgi:hypothetical protein
MKPSDCPAFEPQCDRPVSRASCSMTPGFVASWNTTTSGAAARMTPASADSRPLPP